MRLSTSEAFLLEDQSTTAPPVGAFAINPMKRGARILKVLVADNHVIVRRGVRQVVAGHAGWEFAGEAADGYEALRLIREQRPDVTIVDITLPGLNGVALAHSLMKEGSQTRVLFFTMRDDDAVATGLAAGARGYVLKTDSIAHLEHAIAEVGANRPYFSANVADTLLGMAMRRQAPTRLHAFTPREFEVTRLVAEAASNKLIARRLKISIKTVESHRAAVMAKAGVRSAGELVRFAIKHHLIHP